VVASNRKKPVRTASKARKEVAEPATEQSDMVAKLDPQAFQMVMQIIDKAPCTGADAGAILMLKRELGRVANAQQQSQAPGR